MDMLELAMRISMLIDEVNSSDRPLNLAEELGASKSAMDNWVAGTAPIPFVQMARLARLTDTSLDWLAHGDEFDRYVLTGECELLGGEL